MAAYYVCHTVNFKLPNFSSMLLLLLYMAQLLELVHALWAVTRANSRQASLYFSAVIVFSVILLIEYSITVFCQIKLLEDFNKHEILPIFGLGWYIFLLTEWYSILASGLLIRKSHLCGLDWDLLRTWIQQVECIPSDFALLLFKLMLFHILWLFSSSLVLRRFE